MLTIDEVNRDIKSVYKHIPIEDVVYAVHISLKYKYIYTITPKCACSTLRLALRRLELGEDSTAEAEMKLIHAREYSPLLSPRQVTSFKAIIERPDFFKFCVVRNPYARLLSSYLDRIVGNKPEKPAVLSALGRDSQENDTAISFDEFVNYVCAQSIEDMNPHWRVQYYQTLHGGLSYDFVGKMEQFPSIVAALSGRISPAIVNCLPSKPINATFSESRLEEFYTPRLIELVNRVFEIDFKEFGYEMR